MFSTNSNYDEETAAKLEPMLILLSQLTYDQVETVAQKRVKLTNTEQKIFTKRSLRSLAFLVTNLQEKLN